MSSLVGGDEEVDPGVGAAQALEDPRRRRQDPRALVGVRVEHHGGEVERRQPLLERARLARRAGSARGPSVGSSPRGATVASSARPAPNTLPDARARHGRYREGVHPIERLRYVARAQGCRRRVARAGDRRRAARARARHGRARRRLPAHRRAPPDVRAAVVAVRPDADERRPDGRGPRRGRRDRARRAPSTS